MPKKQTKTQNERQKYGELLDGLAIGSEEMQILQKDIQAPPLSPLQPHLLLHFLLFQSSHLLTTLQESCDLQALAQVVSIT